MSGNNDLPAVFAQGTDQNERIASLLSSVFFRGIRPSFTPAIRRHPLSTWTMDNDENLRRNQQIPIVLFLEAESCEGYMRIIADVLKKAVAESGLLVAERICRKGDPLEIFGSFSPDANVFVIDLCSSTNLIMDSHGMTRSCTKGVISLDPSDGATGLSLNSIPRLVLLSKDNGPSSYSPNIRCHLGDPYTTAVALPEPLSVYGDDGAKSLWMARTALKWMKAVVQTSDTPIFGHSRL